MSRTRKSPHKPRCGLCHPNKLDGNSLKNANRQDKLISILDEELDNLFISDFGSTKICPECGEQECSGTKT